MVKVNNFSFGSIIIDNRKYHHDVLIFADGTVEQRQGGIWVFGSHNIKQKERSWSWQFCLLMKQ